MKGNTLGSLRSSSNQPHKIHTLTPNTDSISPLNEPTLSNSQISLNTNEIFRCVIVTVFFVCFAIILSIWYIAGEKNKIQ